MSFEGVLPSLTMTHTPITQPVVTKARVVTTLLSHQSRLIAAHAIASILC
jgi:hypothetical protein